MGQAAAPCTAKAPTQETTSGETAGDRMEVDATRAAQRSAQSPTPLPDPLGPNPKGSTTADIRVKRKAATQAAAEGLAKESANIYDMVPHRQGRRPP